MTLMFNFYSALQRTKGLHVFIQKDPRGSFHQSLPDDLDNFIHKCQYPIHLCNFVFLFLTFFSLGLLSDRSAPPHVPGPLVSPLIGGLPGSSLLIGQQAACLQLARIKTQLALSQISSAIAAGHQAVASRTVSNTPPYLVSTQAPSPTATAWE